MKVGLYTMDIAATVGGGFVFRDEVARAAGGLKGDHEVVLVNTSATVARMSQSSLGRQLARLGRLRNRVRGSKSKAFANDIRQKKIDLLWFNHLEPIDVGVPYILNIFDLQHRLQPFFPEVSADGQWDHREQAWAPAIRRAAFVTVGSEEAKRDLSLFYGVSLDRIRVVPLPTPLAAIDAAGGEGASGAMSVADLRAKYGISGKFIYYPAQFWAHKNHVNLLRALCELRNVHGLDLSLVLTGSDQGNLKYVKSVARELGIESSVHFLGFIPHADVIALYRNAFALTFVSFFGPENLPPLEAMALGCPVVLANIPGVTSLFGDAPMLVDPRTDTDIAAGIRRVHDDPELRLKMITKGRELALANTRELFMQRMYEIFDEFEPFRRTWPSGL